MIRNFLQMHTKYDSYFLTSDSAELQMFVVKNKEYKALFSWPIKHVNTFRWMVNKKISLPHLIKQIITHSSIGRFSKTTEPPPLILSLFKQLCNYKGRKNWERSNGFRTMSCSSFLRSTTTAQFWSSQYLLCDELRNPCSCKSFTLYLVQYDYFLSHRKWMSDVMWKRYGLSLN